MLYLLLFLFLALIAYLIYVYNKLVSLRNLVDEAWSGVSVQLKKRHNLIPNLVETVKGYGSHEIKTLTKTIKERASSVDSSSPESCKEQESKLGQEAKQLFALAENYPDLKASTNFISLHKNLINIEDDLQYARRYFNGTVRNLNTQVEVFPSSLIASSFGFQKRKFFELEYATERKNPDIEF